MLTSMMPALTHPEYSANTSKYLSYDNHLYQTRKHPFIQVVILAILLLNINQSDAYIWEAGIRPYI